MSQTHLFCLGMGRLHSMTITKTFDLVLPLTGLSSWASYEPAALCEREEGATSEISTPTRRTGLLSRLPSVPECSPTSCLWTGRSATLSHSECKHFLIHSGKRRYMFQERVQASVVCGTLPVSFLKKFLCSGYLAHSKLSIRHE